MPVTSSATGGLRPSGLRRRWLAPLPPRAGSARSSPDAATAGWWPKGWRRRGMPIGLGFPGRWPRSSRPRCRRRGSTPSTPIKLQALEAAAAGNVIITSGTASGKSLSFNLPVLDRLVRDRAARALYLYPDQGVGPGPGPQAVSAGAGADPSCDLRRRHAPRRPPADQAPLEPDPHQPRHAPRRHPSPPPQLG